MPQTLPNLTRIDRREDWPLFHYLTESGARICAALDAERLRVAAAFGAKVRSIEEHYRLSYHVDGADIAGIAEAIHAKYQGRSARKRWTIVMYSKMCRSGSS
jgi:opine dehydrogenase